MYGGPGRSYTGPAGVSSPFPGVPANGRETAAPRPGVPAEGWGAGVSRPAGYTGRGASTRRGRLSTVRRKPASNARSSRNIAGIVLVSVCCLLYGVFIFLCLWRWLVLFRLWNFPMVGMEWAVPVCLAAGLTLLGLLLFSKRQRYRTAATVFVGLNGLLLLLWLSRVWTIIRYPASLDMSDLWDTVYYLGPFILALVTLVLLEREAADRPWSCPSCHAEDPGKGPRCSHCDTPVAAGGIGLPVVLLVLSGLLLPAVVVVDRLVSAWSWGEVLRFPPTLLLLGAGLACLVSGICDIVGSRRRRPAAARSILVRIAAACAAVAVLCVLLIGAQSHALYRRADPAAQLVRQGISRKDAAAVLADFDQLGLYDPDHVYAGRERDDSRRFSVYAGELDGACEVQATDSTLRNQEAVYQFRVEDGRVADLYQRGIDLVRDGKRVENEAGKRWLLQACENDEALVAWVQNERGCSEDDIYLDGVWEACTVDGATAQLTRRVMVNGRWFGLVMTSYTDEQLLAADTSEELICRIHTENW